LLRLTLSLKLPWRRKLSETDDRGKIKRLALSFLARREHSAKELAQKLKLRGAADELAERVVAELESLGFQDERRFVESFIRARAERGMGPVRIRFELKARGVACDLIEQVLAELSIDWEQALREVYRRKYQDLPIETAREYGKRYRFLAQRGFEPEHIRTLLGEVCKL
jgi:regulatory protein